MQKSSFKFVVVIDGQALSRIAATAAEMRNCFSGSYTISHATN